jgi:O-antigen/teichoic acid export membrane protein
VTVAANALLSVLLIPKYGIQGAAYATLGAFVLLNGMRLIEVRILFRIHPFRKDLFKPLVAGGLSFGALFLALKYLPIGLGTKGYFIQGILVFLGVYILLIFSLGLAAEDKIILAKIREKIRL